MVHLIHADRVVSRPLAVVEALAERESSFVKSSSDGHDFLVASKLRIIPARNCHSELARSLTPTMMSFRTRMLARIPLPCHPERARCKRAGHPELARY